MAQHDLVIDNQAGAAFRADLNNALAALVSLNSGPTAPPTTYAFQWWADTTTGVLKRRNAANDGWISVMSLTLSMSALGETLAQASSSAVARTALQVAPISCVRGLIGNVNPTTPLTKYDLSADKVVLSDANGATLVIANTGTMTCDLGLAGAGTNVGTANGRDQAAAFPANSWVYLYKIAKEDGTKATLASLIPPSTYAGASLPAGYTFWAFATAIRWNGSSNIVRCSVSGAKVFYAAAQSAITSGAATSETAIDLSALVPPSPSALTILGAVDGYLFSSTAGVGSNLLLRFVSGATLYTVSAVVETANGYQGIGLTFEMPNRNQTIYYLWDTSNGTRVANIKVSGYVVPNGDA